jgi:hypothetical protein
MIFISVTFYFQKNTAVEKNIKPAIKSSLSNVLTKAGQKVILECSISGKPQPEIYVMHNGKVLSDHDINVSVSHLFIYLFTTCN